MIIQNENYGIEVKECNVIIKGVMRLNGTEEYQEILDILHQVVSENKGKILIDLSQLNLLNSSGITALCKFAIHCRKNGLSLSIKWSDSIAWQTNTVKNLQRLLPTMKLVK